MEMQGVASTGASRSADVLHCLGSRHYVRVLCLAILLWVCSVTPALSEKEIVLIPQKAKLGPLNTSSYWQLPEGEIRKVLVIFLPRFNYPEYYWDRSEQCPECAGHPEKRLILTDALTLKYAIFIPSSIMEPDGDWGSWPLDHPDMENVLTVINIWKKMYGLENVPTVGTGSSAGGFATSTMALHRGLFESICVMISEGRIEAYDAATSEYPPTLYIDMPKDSRAKDIITNSRRLLESKGIVTGEVSWYEHPLTDDWFTIIPHVDLELSIAIKKALITEGWLDEETGYILNDDFKPNWPAPIRRWNILGKFASDPAEMKILEDTIVEELSIAYGIHGTIGRTDPDLFAWFEGSYNMSTLKSDLQSVTI